MNAGAQKRTKRGFVMTGGGAKGIYEAGVINALHLCGMEFDVITGSSIGAINAVFYAEYLFHKRSLPQSVREDAERALEALDDYVRAFHHAWLRLPEAGIIDDSESGPLGQLKDDVLEWNVDIPLLMRLAWWYTTPQRWHLPPARVMPYAGRLLLELAERMGDGRTLFELYRDGDYPLVERLLRAYLRRFGIEHALVPAQPNLLRDFFVRPVTPLHPDHLDGGAGPAGSGRFVLVDGNRTMRDYAHRQIDLRLTRANYRTGRLELSAYTSVEEFLGFLEGRDFSRDITLGSTRLKLPGNPNAIHAAIASGRFPGVFPPYAITDIYPRPKPGEDQPENALLYEILEHGLEGSEVEKSLLDAYREDDPHLPDEVWDHIYAYWRRLPFPRKSDLYVDGGAIDNTPSNSAINAIRETIARADHGRRDVTLDLYVIYLHSEPDPGYVDIYDNPALYQVVMRTLKIQGAAKMTSDADVFRSVNDFGELGEELAQQLRMLLAALRDLIDGAAAALGDELTEEQLARVQAALRSRLRTWFAEQAAAYGYAGPQGEDVDAVLAALDAWSADALHNRLPLHVEPIEIYPDEMTLDTLQFTERLGFQMENAVQALTMGCYNTFWALRSHLEKREGAGELDDLDREALRLARKWMGEVWPSETEELQAWRNQWQCRRTACVFHARHCRHGAMAGA